MLNIIFSALGFLLILGISEFIKKYLHLTNDVTRKVAHMLSGVLIFFLPYYLSVVELFILSILTALALVITKYVGIFQSVHGVKRNTLGEIYFPLSLGLVAIFFLPNHLLSAQFGVLVLAFSDAMASIIGQKYGKHGVFIFEHRKSLEGSLAFFITTCALIFIFVPQISLAVFFVGLLCAFLLTFMELALVFGLDNLFLPCLGAFLFQFMLLALT
jgi:phytol kinase